MTAFIGTTQSGPLNAPGLCQGYEEYERAFGGVDGASHVSYAVRQFFGNGGTAAIIVRVEDETHERVRTGIHALETADTVNLVCLPAVSSPETLTEAMTYCRARRSFLIVDSPLATDTPAKMRGFMETSGIPRSDCAALYYPWVLVPDPLNGGSMRLTAPSGAVAGLFARTDSTQGVWKAPAGSDARLIDVQRPSYTVNSEENGTLNGLGQLHTIISGTRHGGVGSTHPRWRECSSVRVEVHPGPADGFVYRRERVARIAVDGLRAER